jgi:hypothetical protein
MNEIDETEQIDPSRRIHDGTDNTDENHATGAVSLTTCER